ncbi:unnamed protein product [Gadus morhua 'NCC']
MESQHPILPSISTTVPSDGEPNTPSCQYQHAPPSDEAQPHPASSLMVFLQMHGSSFRSRGSWSGERH